MAGPAEGLYTIPQVIPVSGVKFSMHKFSVRVLLPFLISASAGMVAAPEAQALSESSETVNGHHFRVFGVGNAKVQFVTDRPSKTDDKITLCIPAAFTDSYQHIDGVAISNGKRINSTVNKQLGGACVFIDGDTEVFPTNGGALLTEGLLRSVESNKGSLFQQFQLVKDGVPERFRDTSLFQRRAWVRYNRGTPLLFESREALTLSQFAKDLADLNVFNAIYTDMGDWDEGWYRDDKNQIHTLGSSRKATDKQTSWLVVGKRPEDSQDDRSPALDWLKKHWAPPAVQPGEAPFAEWNRAILYSQFPLPGLSTSGGFTLVPLFRGAYENKQASVSVLTGEINYGLIDGRPGAVAFTGWSTGGTGYWEVLTLYRIKAGKIQAVGQHHLEDRATVHKLAVQNNSIVLDWNKHGPNDPAIDPTVHEVIRLHSKDFEPIVQSKP